MPSLCVFLAILAILPAGLNYTNTRRALNAHGKFYQLYRDFVPDDANVGYILSQSAHLFFGKNFNHTISFIPEKHRNSEELMNYIRLKEFDYIAVGTILESWKKKDQYKWLIENNNHFEKVFTTSQGIYVLRVIK